MFELCSFELLHDSAANVIGEHETRTVCDDEMMLALAERKLQQIEWRGVVGPEPREIGLIVAQPIADAVRISVGCVRFDMTERCVRHTPRQQMMNELQQRTTGHAQSTAHIGLLAEGTDGAE